MALDAKIGERHTIEAEPPEVTAMGVMGRESTSVGPVISSFLKFTIMPSGTGKAKESRRVAVTMQESTPLAVTRFGTAVTSMNLTGISICSM
jgi:hypothetical protein